MNDRNTIDELISSDARLSALTAATLESALCDTGLVPRLGWAWLSRAIQGALIAARTPPELAPDRRENCDVRDELFAAAKPLTEAARTLATRSRDFDAAVWEAACQGFEPDSPFDEPPDHRTYSDALHHVEWLAVFLRRAGMLLEPQQPQWRGAAARAERTWRAQCLSVVYAVGFDKEPTINNWETAKRRGPWADFYQRIVSLAYDEHKTPNLLEVLKDARRHDKVDRVRFGPGILPK